MSHKINLQIKATPTILLVEEDNGSRALLTEAFRQEGYRLLVASSLEDAKEWVSFEHNAQADLLLVNLIRKTPEEVIKLGRELRKHAKYDSRTPLVVMAENATSGLDGQDVNVDENDWICYSDDDSHQLHRLVARLITRLDSTDSVRKGVYDV